MMGIELDSWLKFRMRDHSQTDGAAHEAHVEELGLELKPRADAHRHVTQSKVDGPQPSGFFKLPEYRDLDETKRVLHNVTPGQHLGNHSCLQHTMSFDSGRPLNMRLPHRHELIGRYVPLHTRRRCRCLPRPARFREEVTSLIWNLIPWHSRLKLEVYSRMGLHVRLLEHHKSLSAGNGVIEGSFLGRIHLEVPIPSKVGNLRLCEIKEAIYLIVDNA
mmetsp:Transcript_120874/g.233273  ORF Transcript_120874/g.233273 Transcript_120874/m.233273 type:complete len:218 (+) Transcript_120874:2339-2992(+)